MSLYFYQTSLGRIALAEEGERLTNFHFQGEAPADQPVRETPLLREAHAQLAQYLAGRLRVFDLPLAPRGSEFMRRVWEELLKLPFGQTASYSQLAASLGQPRAARAVGLANHRNPLPVFIPCHRVLGKDGRLTG